MAGRTRGSLALYRERRTDGAVRCKRSVPIPSLTTAGLLPEGMHHATLREVEVAFGSHTETRVRLHASLAAFLEWVETFQMFTSIVIDGSFVSDKPDPGDIDAVLLLPSQRLMQLIRRPDYAELANKKVKERFSIDLFIEPDLDGMAKFFQQLKIEDALQRGLPPRTLRGVLQVML